VCDATAVFKCALTSHAATSFGCVNTPATRANATVLSRSTRVTGEPGSNSPAFCALRYLESRHWNKGPYNLFAGCFDGLYIIAVERIRRLVACNQLSDASKVIVITVFEHNIYGCIQFIGLESHMKVIKEVITLHHKSFFLSAVLTVARHIFTTNKYKRTKNQSRKSLEKFKSHFSLHID
jgi:hypothetical protein